MVSVVDFKTVPVESRNETAAEQLIGVVDAGTPGFSTFRRAVSPNASPTIPDVSTVAGATCAERPVAISPKRHVYCKSFDIVLISSEFESEDRARDLTCPNTARKAKSRGSD
jgi:hypothetical protein